MSEPSPYKQLAPKTLWNEAVAQIRNLIDSGVIPVGTRLPAERKLCEQLGISRVSLRESLRVLQSIGYVETRAGSGTYARLPEVVDKNESLADWLANDIHIVELFELRMVVEPGAAALSSTRRSAEDVKAMQVTIDAMGQAALVDDRLAAVAADAEFHRLVGHSVANTAVSHLMDQMQDQSGAERRVSLCVPGQVVRAIHDHQKILDAIAAGNPNAARQAMLGHLEDAIDLIHKNAKSVHLTKQEDN